MPSIIDDFPATPTPSNTAFDREPTGGSLSQSIVVPSMQSEDVPPPTPRPNQPSRGLVADESPNFRRRRARVAQMEHEQAMEDQIDCNVTQSQLSSLSATFVTVRLEVSDLDGLAPYWKTPAVQPMLEHWKSTNPAPAPLPYTHFDKDNWTELTCSIITRARQASLRVKERRANGSAHISVSQYERESLPLMERTRSTAKPERRATRCEGHQEESSDYLGVCDVALVDVGVTHTAILLPTERASTSSSTILTRDHALSEQPMSVLSSLSLTRSTLLISDRQATSLSSPPVPPRSPARLRARQPLTQTPPPVSPVASGDSNGRDIPPPPAMERTRAQYGTQAGPVPLSTPEEPQQPFSATFSTHRPVDPPLQHIALPSSPSLATAHPLCASPGSPTCRSMRLRGRRSSLTSLSTLAAISSRASLSRAVEASVLRKASPGALTVVLG